MKIPRPAQLPTARRAGNSRLNYLNNRLDYKFKPMVLARLEVSAIEFGSVSTPSGSANYQLANVSDSSLIFLFPA